MNEKLYRFHKILAIAYGIGTALFVVPLAFSGDHTAPFFFLGIGGPPALIHAVAAAGAHRGMRWGRNLSRVVGVFLLFGFPLGTAMGIYILSKTSDKWQSATAAPGS